MNLRYFRTHAGVCAHARDPKTELALCGQAPGGRRLPTKWAETWEEIAEALCYICDWRLKNKKSTGSWRGQ